MNPQEVLSQNSTGEKLEWSALEYEEKERSPDWFWALGVIIVAGTISAIIYGNYFFAFLILLGGIMLWFYAIRRPDIIYYELNEKGLKIRSRLYPYENMKSFWVQTHVSTGQPGEATPRPILFIKTERLFMPIISVPINEDWAEMIHNLLISYNIREEEMQEHISEKIMDMLGF